MIMKRTSRGIKWPRWASIFPDFGQNEIFRDRSWSGGRVAIKSGGRVQADGSNCPASPASTLVVLSDLPPPGEVSRARAGGLAYAFDYIIGFTVGLSSGLPINWLCGQ